MKLAVAFTLIAGASAFQSIQVPSVQSSTALFNEPTLGAGGMADTRDPDALEHEDPRKSISEAPSFEEYLKMRSGGGEAAAPAPAAPAPAAPAPVAAAPAAAAPAPFTPTPDSSGFFYGKYDDQMWDMDAKLDVYGSWDPNSPRTPINFNPFETFEGNSPDASGFYPGEGRYKDPKRPDVNFAKMQEERAILDDIAANPKPGNVKGAPGCRT